MKLKYIFFYTFFFLLLAAYTVSVLQGIERKNTKNDTPHVAGAQSKYEKLPKVDDTAMHDELHGDLHNKLETSITFTENNITVTNGETTDLTNCTLELNQTIVQRGYMYTQDLLPSQAALTIPLTSFTRDGAAFDPSIKNAQNVMVMCENGWQYISNR